jgi:predicted metal-dependent peptidase
MSLTLVKNNAGEAAAALTTATSKLINGTDRFYAEILYRLRRKVDYTCMSMGVSLENGGTLIYNPDFVLANVAELSRILVHECLHIVCDHIPRGKTHNLPHSFVNVCADLAVNSLISGFPNAVNFYKDGAIQNGETCTVANYRAKEPIKYKDLEVGRPFEYYVAYFKAKGDAPQRGEGADSHEGWTDIDAESARAIAQRIISEAVKGSKQAGQELPNSVRELVEELMDSGITWEQVLKRFPDTAEVYAKESSRMHRNRRYGVVFPGQKPVRRCTVYVGFDVSGSIGKEQVTKIDNCLREMSELGADIKVLFFDHTLYPVVDYTPGCFDGGQIPGGGGTLFAPVFDYVTEHGGDGLIMATDGLLGDTVEQPNYPVVMAIFDGYSNPFTWAEHVVIK